MVDGEAEDNSGLSTPQYSKEEEEGKRGVVTVTHTVVNPRAVMVHLHHTTPTCTVTFPCH